MRIAAFVVPRGVADQALAHSTGQTSLLGLYMRQALFGTQAVCNQTLTQGLDLYPESYMETHPGANLVANDEIIAHTLQEEFESLAADETSEAASPIVPVFENLQVECQPAV
jgi:hypothetical protein